MINGFIRIASASPKVKVADVEFNTECIIAEARRLESLGVKIAVFPELSLTGYTCADLFHNDLLLDSVKEAIDHISKIISGFGIHIIIGAPLRFGAAVYNCAVLLRGEQVDIIKKSYLPTYNEFYERRWFASSEQKASETPLVFESHGVKIGIEICEDLWVPIPPSSYYAMAGAQIIFNLSASDDHIGKYNYLESLIRNQSGRCLCAYAYASAGYGESSTDLAYMPKNIIAECGNILVTNNRFDYSCDCHSVVADIDIDAINHDRINTSTFSDCAHISLHTQSNFCAPTRVGGANTFDLNYDLLFRKINPLPFVPSSGTLLHERCKEITSIQECGLSLRLKAVGSDKMVIGISGGLDSTLALLVAVATLKRVGGEAKDVIGITMPGFGTTGRTYSNALTLMRLLGITIREIPIADAVMQHFRDIGHDPEKHDVTYENSQARERTQILMDIANQENAIVVGTGDLSELALGWATYNGDQMSMYGINAGVPKTLVRYLVKWHASKAESEKLKDVLTDIIETPISPELTPADENGNIQQITEDLVGPYELHDFFLYYTLRYGFTPEKIFYLAKYAFRGKYPQKVIVHWLKTFYRRFFTQQFKRSCLPDGPKVGSVCLSPRGDWRMPSDASRRLWQQSIDKLEKALS